MKEITLTHKWIEEKTETKTFVLNDGLEIFYTYDDITCEGIVKEIDNLFYIIWEDNTEPTLINENDAVFKRIKKDLSFKV